MGGHSKLLFAAVFSGFVAVACAPEPFDSWWNYERDFARFEHRLDATAKALRESGRRGAANAIGYSWSGGKRGECNALRTQSNGEPSRVLPDQSKTLCALIEGLAYRASVEEDGTVWIATWSFGGALGHDGGVVLPGSNRRSGDTLVGVHHKYSVRPIPGVSRWMVWRFG